MRFIVVCTIVAILSWLVASATGEPQPSKAKPQNPLTSNQALMRDKLKQMNRVLEGLTLDQYDQVEDAAKTLRMISRATSWHISDPTPRYQRLIKNFQEQAVDLERHAKEHNVDAATLDLVRMNVTCAQCHQHMREHATRAK